MSSPEAGIADPELGTLLHGHPLELAKLTLASCGAKRTLFRVACMQYPMSPRYGEFIDSNRRDVGCRGQASRNNPNLYYKVLDYMLRLERPNSSGHKASAAASDVFWNICRCNSNQQIVYLSRLLNVSLEKYNTNQHSICM